MFQNGTMYYSNGDRYEGEWSEDKKKKGILYYSNGDRYEGEFDDDQKSGEGVLFFANGDRYEGSFRKDEMSGRGTYYYQVSGNRHEGEGARIRRMEKEFVIMLQEIDMKVNR